MNPRVVSVIMLIAASIPATMLAAQQAVPASQWVDGHGKITPTIVSDWKLSKHSQVE